jgi:hypothetical protein
MTASGFHLVKLGLLVERSLWDRLKERARVEDVPVSSLVRQLLCFGLDARQAGQGAIPKTRADLLAEHVEECLNQLRVLALLVGAVGRPVLANQQLMVHWATRDGGYGVNEDDLLAELQAAGAESWAQVLDEAHKPLEIAFIDPRPGRDSEE